MHRSRMSTVVLAFALALPAAWVSAQSITDVLTEEPEPKIEQPANPEDASEYIRRELARQPVREARPSPATNAPVQAGASVPEVWREDIYSGRRDRELSGTGLHPIRPLRGVFNPQ